MNFSYADVHFSTNVITSSSLVVGPNDTRSAQAASVSLYPIAISTRLDFTFPLEQADPADTASPARSICITCVSPFQPGVIMHVVFGKRFAVFPTKIVLFEDCAMAFSRMFLSFSTLPHTPASKSWGRGLCRSAKTSNPNDILCARTPSHFLTSPAQLCGDVSSFFQNQRTNTFGTTQFMGRHHGHLRT